MSLSPEVAAAFVKRSASDPSVHWRLLEVQHGSDVVLIVVGTRETTWPAPRQIDIVVHDLSRPIASPPIMYHGGRQSGRDIKVTSGGVFLDSRLKGLGIGTFVFNIVIEWARTNFEQDRDVVAIKIKGPTKPEFQRRANFYRRFGFSWPYPSNSLEQLVPSNNIKVSDLKTYDEAMLPYIREISVPDALRAVIARLEEAQLTEAALVRRRLRDHETRIRYVQIGRRLNYFGLVLCLVIGCVVGRYLV